MRPVTSRLETSKLQLRSPFWRGLTIGFTMLIALIIASGIISAYLVGQLRDQVVDDLERDHIKRMDAVLNLRDVISRIYIEARERQTARQKNPTLDAYKELPEETRLDLERNLAVMRESKVGASAEWLDFERELKVFLANALNPVTYGMTGFQSQKRAVDALNVVKNRVNIERGTVRQAAGLDLKRSAQRNILITTFASLSLGLFVTGLSVREIQRRFRELQASYRAIEEAREFARTVINSSINAIFTLNDEGDLMDANLAFYQLLGASRANLGNSYRDVLAKEQKLLALVEEANGKRAADLTHYRGRVEIGEEPRRVDLYVSPLILDNAPQGMVCTLVDVTETERAQQEIRRNQALAVIGQITAQVAHEIKNPLGGIKLNLSYLQRMMPKENEEVKEILEEFSAGIDRLGKIVNELNQFARPRELVLSSIDLNQLLDEQLNMVADRLQQKKINVVKEYQPDLPNARYDAHELSKAFINFLINAIDASQEGRPIRLSTTQKNGNLTVSIVDQGSGMNKETLARLFEPFYTTKKNGTGLGMSIAKRIIELHGGNVSIRSTVGVGTEVSVNLPFKN